MWFEQVEVRSKIATLPSVLASSSVVAGLGFDKVGRAEPGLGCGPRPSSGPVLGRDVRVVSLEELPPRPGLSTVEGQARLLHDLANIELQAMELAVRTLEEFPEAPKDFRSELADIAMSEARHLALCLDGLEALGFAWGHWPVHLYLWNAVAAEDSLLDRILIVHRYLEGSGLDSGDRILRRLSGVKEKGARGARTIVGTIVREEVDHVLFGSRWYHRICREARLDPEADFAARIQRIAKQVPRRERLARELRLKAGFTEGELITLEALKFEEPISAR